MNKSSLLFLAVICLIYSCSSDDPPCDTSPTFSNIVANEVSYTALVVSGTISTSSCDSNIISQGVVYSTSELPTLLNNSISFSDSVYSQEITNLNQTTTYYLRPFLVNQDGEFYGSQLSITTLTSEISFDNIISESNISSVNISANYSFQQGSGVNTISKGVLIDGNQYLDSESISGNISLIIENLSPNTTYTFRAFVQNQFGTSYSEISSFETEQVSSEIDVLTITNIGYTNADFNTTYENLYSGDDITIDKGVVISTNLDFTESDSYSSEGSPAGQIELSTSSLIPNTLYYAKAFVQNQFGTSYSEISSFETNNAGYNFNSITLTDIQFQQANAAVLFNEIEEPFVSPISKGYLVSTSSSFNGAIAYEDFNNLENGTQVNSLINNLQINQNYYIKAYVSNVYGVFYSDSIEFSTINLEYSSSYSIEEVGYDYINVFTFYNQVNGPYVEILEKGIEMVNNSNYTAIDNTSQEEQISLSLSSLSHNSNYQFIAYVTTEFGKIYLGEGVSVNTLDATPVINSSIEQYGLDNVLVSAEFVFAADTANSLIRIALNDNDNSIYQNLNTELTSQQSLIDNLIPNQDYSYHIEVINEYGSFSSESYLFTTLNDAPSIDFNYQLTGENQINLSAQVLPAPLDNTISTVKIKYKNNEESNFQIINLDPTNLNINEILNDLVQGPNYNFVLIVTNQWNSFEENLYYNLPVTYTVGDSMFGGIIFELDSSGYHGKIIVEPQYYSSSLVWSTDFSYAPIPTGVSSEVMNDEDGSDNTLELIEYYLALDESSPAGDYAISLNINGYNDWYLPTVQEINNAKQIVDLNGVMHGLAYSLI